MQFIKISCAGCSHCAECSKTTRMYVNYCGSDAARVIDRIRAARSYCSRHRGCTMNLRRAAFEAAPAGACAA